LELSAHISGNLRHLQLDFHASGRQPPLADECFSVERLAGNRAPVCAPPPRRTDEEADEVLQYLQLVDL
jgi:hypothetical protein